MKLKWFWAVLVLIAFACAIFFTVKSSPRASLSARLLAQTNDAIGQIHIIYEITNATRHAHEIRLNEAGLECYSERTGWWPTYLNPMPQPIRSSGTIVLNRPVKINPWSAATTELIVPRLFSDPTAIRGKLWHVKLDSQTVLRVRTIARELHLPKSWLPWPKPAFLELSTAQLPPMGRAQVAAAPKGTPAAASAASPLTQTNSTHTPANNSDVIFIAGCVKLREVSLRIVLDMYAEIANTTLEIDPHVRAIQTNISFENSESLSRSSLLRLLEEALQQQAGITFERVDNKRIKVNLAAPGDKKPVKGLKL